MRTRPLKTLALLAGLGLPALPLQAQEPHPPVPPPPPPMTHASQARGWLGFAYRITDVRIETSVPGPTHSSARVTVGEVLKGSPADRAGLEPGDTIEQVNGQPATVLGIRALVEKLRPGDTVHLQVRRGSRVHDLTMKAEERPEYLRYGGFGGPIRVTVDGDAIRHTMRVFMDSARVALDSLPMPDMIQRHDSMVIMRWSRGNRADTIRLPHMDSLRMRIERGIPRGEFDFQLLGDPLSVGFGTAARRGIAGAQLQELNEQLAQYFGVREGLLVERVATGTPAAKAGLEAGDVITVADGRPIGDLADLRRVVRGREGKVKLDVVRKGKQHALELKWP